MGSSFKDRVTRLSPEKLVLLACELQSRLDKQDKAARQPIAVITGACRYPGDVRDLDGFWRLLETQGIAAEQIPAERWNIDEFFDSDPDALGKMTARFGGFLPDVRGFDAHFFGLSPREAERMDPQQRIFLEVAWEAFENCGLTKEMLAGSRTGVFAGVYNYEFGSLSCRNLEDIDSFTGTGTALNAVAGRLSYLFDLRGPSVVVDTACSSSLVAVHLACQSLQAGECDAALAGGVNVMLGPVSLIPSSKMRMLAPDGRCKTFDARADGVGISEGCGVVVLKRLPDALACGDPILGVIRGSAVNQDGRSNGLTAPNVEAQRDVLRKALEYAGVACGSVHYVEAHGTGTVLGDPIEAEAIASVYPDVLVGGVKANLGHAGAAAGISGLLKTLLCFAHECIPAQPRLRTLNPALPAGIRVARESTPWPHGPQPRYAAVSSFGWSGTNVHVVLEEAPVRDGLPDLRPAPYLLPVSARTAAALETQAARWRELLANSTLPIGDICYTAARGRSHFEHRLALLVRSRENVVEQRAQSAGRRPVVFVFSGQGNDSAPSTLDFLVDEPAFQEIRKLIGELSGQTLLFAVQVALASVWKRYGVMPDAIVGHSAGEIAAAYVAGALAWTDAIRIIQNRARLMDRIAGQGRVLAVELPEFRAPEFPADLAAVNSPDSFVLSGPVGKMEEIETRLRLDRVPCRFLDTDVPFHSRAMDSILSEFTDAISGIQPRAAQVALWSTVTGVRTVDLGPRYWARNIRQTVRFADAIRGMRSLGESCWLEIGPHAALTKPLQQCLDGGDDLVVPSLRKGQPGREAFLMAAAKLYCAGHPIDWQGQFPEKRAVVPVPNYAWQHTDHWHKFRDTATPAIRSRLPGTRIRTAGREIVFECHVGPSVWPFLDDHRYFGRIVAPGAAYLAFVLSAAAEIRPEACTLQDFVFHQPLVWDDAASMVMQLVLTEGKAEVFSSIKGRPWQCHASGRLSFGSEELETEAGAMSFDAPLCRAQRCTEDVSIERYHEGLRVVGLELGPRYRALSPFRRGPGCATGMARSAELPHLLDLCFQVMGACGEDAQDENGAENPPKHAHMPASIARVRCHSLPSGSAWSYATRRDPLTADLSIFHENGAPALDIEGFRVARVSEKMLRPEVPPLYAVRWQRVESSAAAPRKARIYVAPQGRPLLETCVEALRELQSADEPLWIVSRGAETDPAQAALWGMASTFALERPNNWGGLIDAEEATTLERVEDVIQSAHEERLMVKNGHAYAPRLEPIVPQGHARLSPDHTYLITGAFGSLGMLTARWLVEQKRVCHLVMVGRREPGPEAAETIGRWRSAGVDVRVTTALDWSGMPPLRGVIHAAGLVEDSLLADQTAESMARVLAAKAGLALELHQRTVGESLDFFVMFSSLAGLFGAAGQANYAAANAVLDGLARMRRKQNLPALSIDWSPWAQVGMAARAVNSRMARRGLRYLEPCEGIEVLDRLLASDESQVAVLPVEWPDLIAGFAQLPGMLREVAGHTPKAPVLPLAPEVARHAALSLGWEPDRPVPHRTPLRDLGLDSLGALELRNGLSTALGRKLPATLLFDCPTVEALISYLEGPAVPAVQMAEPEQLGDLLAELGSLSELDALGALKECRSR